MIISANSQLGLSLWDNSVVIQYLEDSKSFLEKQAETIQFKLNKLEYDPEKEKYDLPQPTESDGDILWKKIMARLGYQKENAGSEFYTIRHPNPYNYLIMPSVEACAAMIRINENFSCSLFNKIKDGEHVYLLGKNEFYRFTKFNGAIRASFWNRERHIAFEIGFHLEEDKYYYPSTEKTEFNRLVRLMIFIELGDIEIVVLEKGRNNGKTNKTGKVTNTSNYTVYVVDSSWNKLIIRTDGFAVKGHFRLQPCGINHSERKLVWINAFEKHGYTRRPKAEIIN